MVTQAASALDNARLHDALEHGGELSVESELGVGTTFHLTLPL